jgi:hypothetical protein
MNNYRLILLTYKTFFMKRILLVVFISAILNLKPTKADEGMWLLPLLEKLNYATMKDMGLQLTPDQIYSINNSSLKDAIVIFGRGCTGEIISNDGLLITNHHCGYDQIQSHSAPEHNYLDDGFWAFSRDQELPNPGLTVTFLVSIKEVTDSILSVVNDKMTEPERNDKIATLSQSIEKLAVAGTNYKARVRSFFDRNRYFLFMYEEYFDVRLVGTPPSSIGKFGNETDNWMWPRHTGDFSMFRVYTGPDGKPAKYSPNNIPLKPKYHLPISLKGVEKGDFAMVIGYPGTTNRYIPSWGVEELLEVTNPNRIKIRGIRQEILKADMQADEKVDIMYASKYARSSNYWKYSIGQNKGIIRLDVVEQKRAQEKQFSDWVNANDDSKTMYGNVLADLQQSYADRKPLINNLQLLNEVFRSTEILVCAQKALDLAGFLASGSIDSTELKNKINVLKAYAADFYKDYNLPTDLKVSKALFSEYYTMVPAEQRPDFYKIIETKFKGNIAKYVDNMYAKSIFVSQEKLNKFLDKPNVKTLLKDPAFIAAQCVDNIRKSQNAALDIVASRFDKAKRLYTRGLLEMEGNKAMYPDANQTMRFTYGTVGDYSPGDAVHYNYYTTLKGVMEKEDPKNPEFMVPEKLKELYTNQDYGRYSAGSYMPVCFTTNNDITGGNSGSPVLNAKGELIGLAFDGNWEAMSGDIVFEKEIQKTICVDIRYVLFIIDKFAGATNLIEEITIVD